MITREKCDSCKHRLTLPQPNGEQTLYFCGNQLTKLGPNPIGYLRADAPACALHSGRRTRVKRGPAAGRTQKKAANGVLISADMLKHASPSIEVRALKMAITLSTILHLGEWLGSEIKPELSASLIHLTSGLVRFIMSIFRR
jgi:hypothetical protein